MQTRIHSPVDLAIGLVLGIGITSVFYESIKTPHNPINQQAQQIGSSSVGRKADDQKQAEEGNPFAYWARRLVAFEDTLAQWLMMFFTIAAAGLLWQTLRVTRQMSVASSRAYLHVSKSTFKRISGLGHFPGFSQTDVFEIRLSVSNTGNTPASWYEVEGFCRVREQRRIGGQLISESKIVPLRWAGIAGNETLTCPFVSDDMPRQFIEAGSHVGRLLEIQGVVRYSTEFGEIKVNPFHYFAHAHMIEANMRVLGLGSGTRKFESVRMMRANVHREED